MSQCLPKLFTPKYLPTDVWGKYALATNWARFVFPGPRPGPGAPSCKVPPYCTLSDTCNDGDILGPWILNGEVSMTPGGI